MSGYSRTCRRVKLTTPKATRSRFITVANTGRRTLVSESHIGE